MTPCRNVNNSRNPNNGTYPIQSGPVASNHGNLQKHRYLPWFKGHYGVHAKVNGMKGKKGITGTGTETGTERADRRGRNEEGNSD